MSEDRDGDNALQATQIIDHLDAVAAETAHDFGNLLQCAVSALRLSQRHLQDRGDDRLAMMVHDAQQALKRAAVLAWRLAGIDEPHRGTMACSVEAAIVSVERLLRNSVGEAIRLDIDASGPLPRVLCEVADLENAVLNLVINAREAMPNGGRLSIKACAAENGDRMPAGGVTITVTDTGCGMTSSIAQMAFERSFSTKGDDPFRGLGLASVSRFAASSGGRVELKSRVGEGTSAVLYLPAACLDDR
jgi:signal transduction histidine kinase